MARHRKATNPGALVAKDCIYDQIVRANQQSVNGAAHDDTEICAAPIDVDVSGGGTFAAGTEVDFDVTINAGTVDSNGDYTLLVNFGDGSSRTIAVRETFPTTRTTVSHTYDVPGEYEVTVEARDSVGLSDDTLDFVQIGSDLQGRITDAPTFVELGNAAFIRGEAEGGWFPGADKRYEVVMNYGDGTVASGFFNFDLDRQPLVLSGNYTYDEPGEYDVVMTLRDGTSREIRRTRRIEVRPPADCTEVGPGCPALPIQAGQWASTYGTGPLRQVGNTIEYRYDSQDGRIVDTVYNPSTRVLTGYWAEPSAARQCDTSRDGTRYWGRIIWTFAADGKSFSGSWSYCDAEPAAGWSGSLVE